MNGRDRKSNLSTPNRRGPDHRSANRVLDILERLGSESRGLSLHEISSGLKAPKSSLLPLLRTLEARQYIEQDPAGAYRPGSRMAELGLSVRAGLDLVTTARPLLEQLSRSTGETVMLAKLASDRLAVIYVDKVESVHPIRYTFGLGERRPLHSTSSGKVLLAHMSPDEREQVLKSIRLERITDSTVQTKTALREEIESARNQGYHLNIDQAILGRCAIAAPIFDHAGRAAAACVLGAPKERAQPQLPQFTRAVIDTAAAISLRLGHR